MGNTGVRAASSCDTSADGHDKARDWLDALLRRRFGNQSLSEFLRHLEDERLAFSMLFKKPQFNEIQKIRPRDFIRDAIGGLILLDSLDHTQMLEESNRPVVAVLIYDAAGD